MFTEVLFTTAKAWKRGKCASTEDGIKKMWFIHTVEYYSAIKKNEIMPFTATWMQLEIIILSEIERKRQISHNITCMQNLKHDTEKLTCL